MLPLTPLRLTLRPAGGQQGGCRSSDTARDTLLVLADEQRGIALTKDEVLFQQLVGFLSWEEEP